MAETIPGGFYIGADGKAHDAWGKPVERPDVVLRIEAEKAPQPEGESVETEAEKPEPKRKAKR